MSRNDIVIRPVQLSDAVQVRDNCFSMNTLEQVQSQIERTRQLFERGEGVQLVAEVGGVVVGTATLRRNTHPLHAHHAELESIVVHGGYQRQGIAHCLVDECRGRAKAMGIRILEVSSRGGEPAEQVYRRLGFIEYGRLPQGIVELWGDHKVFDLVYFYQPLEHTP
jgi:ribosomal protein S18 acetylase RimI-like enzyme